MALKHWVGLMGLMAAMAASSVGARAEGELTEAQLRQNLVGQSIMWWADGGFLHGALDLTADGRAAITIEHPVGSDVGRWRILASQLCTTWSSARDGAELCYHVRQITAHRFVTTSGHVFELVGPSM